MNNIDVGDVIQTKNKNIYRVINIEKFKRGWQKDTDYITGELLIPDPDRSHPPKGKSLVNMHANTCQKMDVNYALKQLNHWTKVLAIINEDNGE